MTYSIVGILAFIILVIINRDILWTKGKVLNDSRKAYRCFLFGIMLYLATDLLWGILEEHGLTEVLYADTVVHFIAMAAAVMLWTRYVVSCLDEKKRFGKALVLAGHLFLAFEIAVIIVNFFVPIQFWFDESGAYHAEISRYITLAIQIALFLITAIYMLYKASRTEGRTRRRHLMIGLFGLAMVALICVQVFYPLLPFYAMGYLFGSCLLHSFVVEDEREEYLTKLEEAVERERLQKEELAENREELRKALAVAEEASKAKTAFLSNMSHEIRTPMNAIIGLTNIASNDPTASDSIKTHLGKIDTSAQHLLGIINDILDMSRIESGRITINNEEFSFAKLLEHINTIISSQCHNAGLNYECRTDGKIDEYYIGDEVKLRQILINILGNAVKFTPEGGSVLLSIENVRRYEGKTLLRFVISDTGIGISEDYLPHIFDAFSQEDSSSTSKYGSTGLGMPITKSLVELMNGSIDVKSEKGVGSTFTVTVTLRETERKEHGETKTDVQPAKLNVLVIDDDPIALEHAQIVLKQVGVHCDVASSGKDGIEKVRLEHTQGNSYDLILVDWRMPDIDGVETTKQIRSIVGGDIPIIILTSYNWDEIAGVAKAAGVDTFVSKPLFAENVLEEFGEAINRKKESLTADSEALKGLRILLAEDVPINAEIMVMVLSMKGMTVDVAENGKIAVDMFKERGEGYYDAILMDLRMPVMNGLEATAAIRGTGTDYAKEIPVIALTANAFDEDVQHSMKAGLNAHLSKPVNPDILFETLENLINKHQ